MKTYRRPLAISFLVVALVLLAVGVWHSGRDRVDPRREWVAQADAACHTTAAAAAERGVPDGADTDGAQEFAAYMARSTAELADTLRTIPAHGPAVEVAAAVITQVELRGSLWEDATLLDTFVHEEEGFNGELFTSIDETYVRVADAVTVWGGSICGSNPLGLASLAALAGPTPLQVWISAAEDVCLDAHADYQALDVNVDTTQPEVYLVGVAERTQQLAGELRDVADPPVEELAEPYKQLISHVETAAMAANAGNIDLARTHIDQWREVAERLELAACAAGVVGAHTGASYLLADPPTLKIVDAGFDDVVSSEGIADAEAVIAYMSGLLVEYADPSPANAYNIRHHIPLLIAEHISAAVGAVEATPATVSVSERTLYDETQPVGEQNPWVVGIAVRDTSGVCKWTQLFGVEVLYGYTPAMDADGECTGNAAAAGYPG